MKPVFKTEKTELRSYEFEIRADKNEEHGSYLEGTPIVFDQKTDLGWYDEIIDRHALDNCDLKDVRFLVNHNTDMTPLARSRNNNDKSTMQMVIREDAMHIRVNLDTENNSDSRNLYSAVDRGDVSGMSFMFYVRGDKWDGLDSDHPVRTITDIGKVYEVSAVTFPAYEQTTIDARAKETLESAKATLESAKAEKRKQEEADKARLLQENERSRTLAILTNL